MGARKLAPRTLAVLKAVAAGQVTGSGNVWSTGSFVYRMKDESGRERTVTASVQSLQHQGLVEQAPKFDRPREPKVFTAKVTEAGRARVNIENLTTSEGN